MKKMIVLMAVLLLALPVVAAAEITGQCVNCHTMHNSEQNLPVAGADAGDVENRAAGAYPNLLYYDCLGCHANNPAGTSNMFDLTGAGDNLTPQVAHSASEDLAGGNFKQSSERKVHSVTDFGAAVVPQAVMDVTAWNQPPGLPHTSNRHVFTSENATKAFDMFTCAGARGCHGTRSQAISAEYVDNGTANNWTILERRTGMAAIAGSHHNNKMGARTTTGYGDVPAEHSGVVVGEGFRFIVGLNGYENTTYAHTNEDHNEYYGSTTAHAKGCGSCHVQDSSPNRRAGSQSGIKAINNSMSGFCTSCHGYFHSAGLVSGTTDYVDNGVSGAFLRHPSDFVLPSTTAKEYVNYTTYNTTAPVARPTVLTASSTTVTPGTDMVMCLSCHVAHGSANDYLLRFDYTTMTAGTYTQAEADALGGCFACHTTKGVEKNPTP